MNIIEALTKLNFKIQPPPVKKKKPLSATMSYPKVVISNIMIDKTMQRDIDAGTIQKIVNNFDWTKVKTPICISDDTNDIYVVDGQHTLTAIAALEDNACVTIQLHKFSGVLTPSERTKYGNELFLSCNNGIRKNVGVYYKLRAAMVAGDATAKNIFKICKKHGVILTPNDNLKALEASNVAQIVRVYKKYKHHFEKAIIFHSTQFPDDIIDGSMIGALANFYHIYGNDYDSDLESIINSNNFNQLSKSVNNKHKSIHDISNSKENKKDRTEFYIDNAIPSPKGWDPKHTWTFGNILLSHGVDIDLTKI